MNTKIIKKLTIIATILLIIAIGTTTVFGLTPIQMTGTDPQSDDIEAMGNKIIGILQTVGVVLSVIIIIVLGIKYMMGSAEEKAEYKKTMMPYLIGAVFIFLAPTIANVIYNFLKS